MSSFIEFIRNYKTGISIVFSYIMNVLQYILHTYLSTFVEDNSRQIRRNRLILITRNNNVTFSLNDD